MHGLAKCGNSHAVSAAFWNAMMANGVKPNENALAVGICAAARAKNEKLLNFLVASLKKSENLSPFAWNLIICAFGRLGNCERMWSEYGEYRNLNAMDPPNFNILTTLRSMEKRENFKRTALNEAVPFFEKMSDSQSKLFYRAALSLNEMAIAQKLEKKSKINSVRVVASFEFEGMRFSVHNCDNFCDGMLDELMKRIDYKVSVDEHPELNDCFGAHNFVKHHAEKKALAFLLNQKVNDIEICVNMRMCRDCHSFFKAVSRYYHHVSIQCVDPRTRHRFKNGECTCGA